MARTIVLYFCACPKPGPGFPMSYVMVFFYVPWFEVRGSCSFCWYRWNCWRSMVIFLHNLVCSFVRLLYCHSPDICDHRFGQFIVILQPSVTIVLASLLSFSRHLWPSFWPVYCHSPGICDHRFGQFIVILQASVTIVLASLLS